jgi:hypothetical protein
MCNIFAFCRCLCSGMKGFKPEELTHIQNAMDELCLY